MTKRKPRPPCPEADQHTPAPDGYIAWHEWAEEMDSKGYRQKPCPGCGLLKIWSIPDAPGGAGEAQEGSQ